MNRSKVILVAASLVGVFLAASLTPSNARPDEPRKGNGGAPGQKAAAASGGKVYVCPPCGLDCDKLTFDKPGFCPQCGMALEPKTNRGPIKVAILLFDFVEIIDYSGPWEVFGQAGFSVFTVAASDRTIKTVFGQRVVPDYTFENCPAADIVLIPGGGVSVAAGNDKVIRWIQSASKDADHVMSVCTGAFLLAKAGLLDGLSATTVNSGIDRLAQAAPKTKVVHDKRFVDNGKVITTAGLSSGIDGAFHLVEKIKGRGAAQSTALDLEYQWDPDSKYARAAMADRCLPRPQGLDSKILAREGDRDRWEIRLQVSAAGSIDDLVKNVSKQISERTLHTSSPVTMSPPRTKSEDAAEFDWKLTDDEGRGWHGHGSVARSKAGQGVFVVTLKLARD
jgi:putative intracellular protease/amidase